MKCQSMRSLETVISGYWTEPRAEVAETSQKTHIPTLGDFARFLGRLGKGSAMEAGYEKSAPNMLGAPYSSA